MQRRRTIGPNAFFRFLSKLILKIGGWRLQGEPPAADRWILLAVPHTSNWDLLWLLTMGMQYNLKLYWMGKNTIFRWPFGTFFKWLGGIPINRKAREGVVQQVSKAFSEHEKMVLVIPPEGTRSRTEYWKSGFYHIARQANVPIALAMLDYGNKVGGFGPTIMASGDIEADMAIISTFYEPMKGKYPDQFGPVRLRPEEEPGPSTNEVANTRRREYPRIGEGLRCVVERAMMRPRYP